MLPCSHKCASSPVSLAFYRASKTKRGPARPEPLLIKFTISIATHRTKLMGRQLQHCARTEKHQTICRSRQLEAGFTVALFGFSARCISLAENNHTDWSEGPGGHCGGGRVRGWLVYFFFVQVENLKEKKYCYYYILLKKYY